MKAILLLKMLIRDLRHLIDENERWIQNITVDPFNGFQVTAVKPHLHVHAYMMASVFISVMRDLANKKSARCMIDTPFFYPQGSD